MKIMSKVPKKAQHDMHMAICMAIQYVCGGVSLRIALLIALLLCRCGCVVASVSLFAVILSSPSAQFPQLEGAPDDEIYKEKMPNGTTLALPLLDSGRCSRLRLFPPLPACNTLGVDPRLSHQADRCSESQAG